MPKIIQQDGSIIDGDDLSYTSVTNYKYYLQRALNLNNWTADETDHGSGGYYRYHLKHPNEAERHIHVYLKPVVWRHRHEEEKAAQMSAGLDMRGFDAINNGDAEKTYSFGIYRDPTASRNITDQNDPYVICAWNPTEWGENHGVSSFNYFIRAGVISEAFKIGFASWQSNDRRVFAFRPEFIHYYLLSRDSLHETGQGVAVQIPPAAADVSRIPLNQILYGPPGTGKTYATISKAVEIINGYDTTGMPWSEVKEAYDDLVDSGKIRFVTFHQSYSYEEFIEGIKPVVDGDNVRYEIVDGTFKKLCLDALRSKIRVGEVFQNGNGNNMTIVKSNMSITNIQRENGAIVTLPTHLILNLVNLVREGSLSLQNISDRERDGQNIEEFLEVRYDRYIFGYDSVIRPLVDHILNSDLDASQNYVMVIDEINRGNISRIFGELITLIEDSKRLGRREALTAKLTYSGQNDSIESFGVPPNVYLIGTMNSADRSIALIDTALRRRFTFYNYPSDANLISDDVEGINIRRMFIFMNKRIEFLLDKDHLLGHGYFMHVDSKAKLGVAFRNKIIPLLEEYFYGDFEKIQYVLGDNPEFGKEGSLRMISLSAPDEQRNLFGTDIDGFEDKSIYSLRSDLQEERYNHVPSDVYVSIYEKIVPAQAVPSDTNQNDDGDNQ
jgi:hypothetical protein